MESRVQRAISEPAVNAAIAIAIANFQTEFDDLFPIYDIPDSIATMKRKIGALEKVDADLPDLQHKIKGDPSSYQDDFIGQYLSLIHI